MSIAEYWDSTIEEVGFYLDAYKLKREAEAHKLYQQAYLNGVAYSFYSPLSSSKKHFPKFSEFFPEYGGKESQQQDWRIAKERMEKFAMLHNRGGK